MPASQEILSGLATIANHWRWLAMAWHVCFSILALGLALGVRPSRRVAGIALALPLLSAGAVAWASANPFNGVLLTLSGIALIVVASRLPASRIQLASLWAVMAGAMMFALGWVYPRFLATSSLLPYLYAAPTGTVPCPTLSSVIGVALAVGGLRSRAWSLILGATGAFYGLLGAARLGVALDWVLFVGALLLVLVGLTLRGDVPTDAAA